jgi:hypothetical protein
MEAWHLDQNGVDKHEMALCTLNDGHDGEHRYGPWFDVKNCATVTISRDEP